MQDGSIELRHERAFVAWLKGIERDLLIPAEVLWAAEWVREFFWANGEVPTARFAHVAFNQQATMTAHALESMLTAARHATGEDVLLVPDLTPPDEETPVGSVMVAESDVQAFDDAGVRVDVADAVQTYIADRYGVVWPVCNEHHAGLHAVRHGASAVWWCNVGNHESAVIPRMR